MGQDIGDDPESIVNEFKTRFYDTKIFQDKYARGKFAQYLFRRHDEKDRQYNKDNARHLLEETQLLIEAAHACNLRLMEQQSQEQKESLAQQKLTTST